MSAERAGRLGVGDLDLLEINEAFAAVALASIRDLGVSPERVNVNGAIALRPGRRPHPPRPRAVTGRLSQLFSGSGRSMIRFWPST
jgi:hypothetical protein